VSIDTYAELKTALGNLLGADASDRHDEHLEIALAEINLDLVADGGIRDMERSTDLPLEAARTSGTVGGTATAITLTPSTAISAYTRGMVYDFTAASTTTGATTLNISGVSATAIRQGEDGDDALEAGDIVAGGDYTVVYDGTFWRLGPPGAFPLPARFGGLQRAYLDGDPKRPLEFMPRDQFWSTYMGSETDLPVAYTIEEHFIIFGPRTDATRYCKIMFVRTYPIISGSTSNWIIDHAEGLWLYGGCVQSAPYRGDDPRIQMWAALYDNWLSKVLRANKRERFSGPLVRRNRVKRDLRTLEQRS
jgi:hypothetical protein